MDTRSLQLETEIHGATWELFHRGFFGSTEAVRPFLERILSKVHTGSPDVIADLGGGTGFLLHRLKECLDCSRLRLMNVDISKTQLAENADAHVKNLCRTIIELEREDLVAHEEDTLMLLMRSVFHYFPEYEFDLLLDRIRELMKPGECFIHQTVCHEDELVIECVNELYKLMGIKKWFPRTDKLVDRLNQARMVTCSIMPTIPLPLYLEDLTTRYHLDNPEEVVESLRETFGPIRGVLHFDPEHRLTAYLPYRILVSRAVV